MRTRCRCEGVTRVLPDLAPRQCKSCGGWFEVGASDVGFVTCPECRHPLLADGGGCHYWDGAAPDPRVTKANELGDQWFERLA